MLKVRVSRMENQQPELPKSLQPSSNSRQAAAGAVREPSAASALPL